MQATIYSMCVADCYSLLYIIFVKGYGFAIFQSEAQIETAKSMLWDTVPAIKVYVHIDI